MIYMVDHVFADPVLEPAWHEWYSGYLQKLISVPGIHTAQRFKAIGCAPSRYLAMYSIESEDVYSSEPYRSMGGGGSQSQRFHCAYQTWTRNLFEGAARAPLVNATQRVLVFDRKERDGDHRLGSRLVWLKSVGLHRTTPYRALAVLEAAEAAAMTTTSASYLYEPYTTAILAPGCLG